MSCFLTTDANDGEIGRIQLVCKICASRANPQNSKCCVGNQFLTKLKEYYIKGELIPQFRETLNSYLEKDSICTKHGYLIEFVLDGEIQCKQCLVEKIDNRYPGLNLQLFNNEYIINLEKDQNQIRLIEKKFEEMCEQLQFMKNQKAYDMCINNLQKIKYSEINRYQEKLNNRINNDSSHLDPKQIEQLKELLKAYEKRLDQISSLKNDNHEFFHDEFCETSKIRHQILGDQIDGKFDQAEISELIPIERLLQQMMENKY